MRSGVVVEPSNPRMSICVQITDKELHIGRFWDTGADDNFAQVGALATDPKIARELGELLLKLAEARD